jgi:hypothetical protein
MRSELEHRVLRWFGRDASRPHTTDMTGAPAHEHAALARAWGIEACDVCGRTILLGESVSRFSQGARIVKACPICEESLISEGHPRAA